MDLSLSMLTSVLCMRRGSSGADVGTHAYILVLLCDREVGCPKEICRNWEREQLRWTVFGTLHLLLSGMCLVVPLLQQL